jgi:hypothetical protein
MPAEQTFAVGLPVPATANVDRLALAVLVPAESVLDGATGTGRVWTLALGTHDTENGLYVVTLGGLRSEGTTVVLIEHPDFAPGSGESAALRSRSVDNSANFQVQCHVHATNCEVTLQRTLDALEHAHAVYSQFFDKPNLASKRYIYCGQNAIICTYYPDTGGYRGIYIYADDPETRDDVCDSAPGSASFDTREIHLCFDATRYPAAYFDSIVAHELFHAYQMGLKDFWETPRERAESWIGEGTATAAAGSVSSIVSPPGSRL